MPVKWRGSGKLWGPWCVLGRRRVAANRLCRRYPIIRRLGYLARKAVMTRSWSAVDNPTEHGRLNACLLRCSATGRAPS